MTPDDGTKSPHDRISITIRSALKAGDRERVSTLRMLLNEIDNERIRSKEEVAEQDFLRLVRRAVKQREESASQYQQGGREELAAKERREIAILSEYLPEEIGDDELRRAISEIISSQSLSGPAGLGPIMKQMMQRYAGRTDGGRVNRIAREILAGD